MSAWVSHPGWKGFFRVICRHGRGHSARINPRIVSEFNDHHTNQMAARLFMVGLPPGEASSLDPLAAEWIQTEGAL